VTRFWIVLGVLWILAACANNPTGNPARMVERYLLAKVSRDDTALRRLLCSEMEDQYERELRSFETVSDAHLDGMACRRVGETNTVRCTGVIWAVYGSEQTKFPLTTYRVVWEDGEWKWCGEAP